MSLNVSFKGYVYDEDGNSIDCKYQAYYVTQDVWNDVRDTDSEYYSFNAGDGDSLTQDGNLSEGDKIIISFWAGDGDGGDTPDNRDSIYDRFATYTIVYDGETDEYDIDVELRPKEEPHIRWSVPEVGTINEEVTVHDYTSDVDSWTYNDVTFVHDNNIEGETIFSKVNDLTVTFNYNDDNDDDDEVSENKHTYTSTGTYNVDLKVVNAWNKESTDTKSIDIKYHKPIPYVIFDPDGVNELLHVTEDVTVTADITDEDNRITDIVHTWRVINRDSGDEISKTDVDENTEVDYEYTQTINVLQRHFAIQTIKWNDGFDDLEFTYEREVKITNWLPLVNFSLLKLSSKTVKFTPNCTDIDGTVDIYDWKLLARTPGSDEYTEVKAIHNEDDSEVKLTLEDEGDYRMVLTGTDDYGDSASHYKNFTISSNENCAATLDDSDIFFIIPDELVNY